MFKYAPGQPQVQQPGVGQSALPSGIMQRLQQVQQPGKQLGGSFGPQNIKYGNPMQPQVQQPGVGQSALPSGIMQRIQQLQQRMPPMQPQKPVSAARQYLNAMQQFRQGGGQGVMPRFAQFQQPQGQQLGGMGQQLGGIDAYQQFLAQQRGDTGMPPIGQPMDQQRQPGMVQSPEMQAYYAQDAANQAQRSQMMQQGAMQAGQGASPMGGAPNLSRMSNGIQQITGAFGATPQPMTQPPAGAFGATPQPMTQPPAGGFGAAPPPPPPPALGMAMGGSVGMAPPNPYSQQIGQEDPRMQAMRYMQQMNFGG